MKAEEGYIKYQGVHTNALVEKHELFSLINELRTFLYHYNMIGQLDSGIGFGNISWRQQENKNGFYISGSGTGNKEVLDLQDYALVEDFSIAENSVKSIGKVPASSESLSHGAIYTQQKSAQCVAHVHHEKMFEFLKGTTRPFTGKEAEFGTVKLAQAIGFIAEKSVVGCLYSLGHVPGIFFWATNPDDLKSIIINVYREI